MSDKIELQFLDERLCFALYSTSKAVVGAYGPYLAEMEITYPQYLVLIALFENNELSVSQLGGALFLDSGTLTPLLKRMEFGGLVVRKRSHDDERVVVVSMTAKARQYRDKIAEMQFKISCDVNLEPEEFITLRRQLKDLNLRMRGKE